MGIFKRGQREEIDPPIKPKLEKAIGDRQKMHTAAGNELKAVYLQEILTKGKEGVFDEESKGKLRKEMEALNQEIEGHEEEVRKKREILAVFKKHIGKK